MKQYGLTPDDLKYCRDKIDAQRSYLSNNHFHTSTGQVKSLLDVSFSANISERYYSQLSNKINTMSDLAKSQNLKPTFLTITLDGFFRGLLTANYSKWDKLKPEKQTEYLRHIPNNETYGFLRGKINQRLKFTVKDCYNVLAFQWYHYSSGYAFKKLKKEHKQFIYLKAAEPHKDGVPHFHVLLWIPESYFDQFKKDFERYFPAPRNHKLIKEDDKEFFKRHKRYPKFGLDCNEGDTYGFITLLHNPVGYIMKYATKSFMDLRTGEELNYLQSWYIKHKIRRLTTSHSTIPQWVYQKCYALESDWFHLTDIQKREPLLCEWSQEDNWFQLIEDSGRSIEYDNGLLTLRYIDGPIIKQLGEKTDRPKTQPKYIEPVPQKWMKPKEKKFIECDFDGEHFLYHHGELIKPTQQPKKMSDYTLLQYWQNIDLEIVNAHHFAHVKNEMITRGLIAGEIIPLENNLESKLWGFENDLFMV